MDINYNKLVDDKLIDDIINYISKEIDKSNKYATQIGVDITKEICHRLSKTNK